MNRQECLPKQDAGIFPSFFAQHQCSLRSRSLEVGRKHFGRGCPGWVSWFSVWDTLWSVLLNIKGQNAVGEWVTNDQNQSIQSPPPQLQGQGTAWLCTFTFLLSLIKDLCTSPVNLTMCSQVMWWRFWGVQSWAEMGRSPSQMKQNAEFSWKMRDRA